MSFRVGDLVVSWWRDTFEVGVVVDVRPDGWCRVMWYGYSQDVLEREEDLCRPIVSC